jgi:hypothetical protein
MIYYFGGFRQCRYGVVGRTREAGANVAETVELSAE